MSKKLNEHQTSTSVKERVVWTDSWCPEHGWCELIDIDTDEYLIESVGILVDETDKAIILASSQGITNPNKIINPILIPKCSIKERKVIK